MTLGDDDVEIAKKWLGQPDRWADSAVVASFERAFAKWNGSRFAFAFSAGRKSLSACIHALNLGPGDEVIVPGYTCIVVQNAFEFAGVSTVHCDIELDTYGPEVTSVAACVTPRTKAILIHHLFGLVCRDYDGLLELARSKKVKVIEDCAHSTGASFRGKRVGNYGHVAFYSAEWSKVFTSVTGGVAVTNDAEIATRMAAFSERCAWPPSRVVDLQLRTVVLAALRKQAKHWWTVPLTRFKYGSDETISTTPSEVEGAIPDDYYTRMPAPAADLASNQLTKVDCYNESRLRAASIWDQWCEKTGYRKPMILPESTPVFLRYPVLVEPAMKQNTEWAGRELGIDLGVWFVSHLHPSPRLVKNCPNADRAVAQCVNFPCILPAPKQKPY
jgi:dTDP-4-amino-4,6-dideoxygalactose transaminase